MIVSCHGYPIIQRFGGLAKKASDFSVLIYQTFSESKDYGFKDQIQRASLYIMNNIAEGYGRRSDKALMNFLTIARGSAAEVESMILMAHQLQYINLLTQNELLTQAEEVAKLLTGFINKISSDN